MTEFFNFPESLFFGVVLYGNDMDAMQLLRFLHLVSVHSSRLAPRGKKIRRILNFSAAPGSGTLAKVQALLNVP